MNAVTQIRTINWSRFTIDEWLKQYAAFLSINRMRGGHEPNHLEINTIYWLVRENDNSGRSSHGKFVYLQINEFEYDQVDSLIRDALSCEQICKSAQVCIQLYLIKMIEGLSDESMTERFIFGQTKIREMVFCGRYYLCGHDKRLKLDLLG
ncbi:hypothetical protein F900_00699 [Acinetobacter modestus]|uniref:Uncharacterized protein n=1 Tax=Acinetobacter modestus TaxID=1776740 RepID=N9NNQ3_9GAMM|nr:hypothetical protein [Acinetobacter modestus]ENX03605.1 hypothetical protein F900_00699 [Acinetobacter modestus]